MMFSFGSKETYTPAAKGLPEGATSNGFRILTEGTFPLVLRSLYRSGIVVRFDSEFKGAILNSTKHPEHVGKPFETPDSCFDATKWEIYTAPKHPFLNPNNSHYAMVDGIEAIEQMEKMYTAEELKAWAKITAMKYRLRIGAKDDATKEVNKIKEYEAYYKYLEEKPCE